MNMRLNMAMAAAICPMPPALAADSRPSISLISEGKALPLASNPAQFAKASGFVLRLTMVQAGKASTAVKAGKLAFTVESKDKPGSTFRLVRFGFDEKKGRIVTMGSSKLSPAKDIEFPAPDSCIPFEIQPGEKPGTWTLTSSKEVSVGQYGLYVYHSRGFSFDAIKADLFEFTVE